MSDNLIRECMECGVAVADDEGYWRVDEEEALCEECFEKYDFVRMACGHYVCSDLMDAPCTLHNTIE